jgi:UDP-3-O-[3-hydroxymyristoyl] glucosamine N-acyltransferase
MKIAIGELARRIDGEVKGDPERLVSGVAPFETAAAGDITLAAEAGVLKKLNQTDAGCIIVPLTCEGTDRDMILSANPRVAFARAIAVFHPSPDPEMSISSRAALGRDVTYGQAVQVDPFVSIGDRVTLGNRVRIYPHVFIGDDVTIGDDVVIYPHVSILARCSLGSRVIIHAGTVIGSDGFGFAPDGSRYHKVPHVGTVVIEDDVEIGANNAIDRATFGKTWIRRGVKTDNLIQIAHNVEIGEDTVIVALTGIAGSATIGRHVILAGQVGVSGHLTVGDNAVVGPKTGLAKSVAAGETVMGYPAMPIKQFMRQSSLLARLPDMKKKLAELAKKMRDLNAADKDNG